VRLRARAALGDGVVEIEAEAAVTIEELERRLDLWRQRCGTPVPKRVALDGRAYTQESFLSYYGGLAEWEAAEEGGSPDHLEARLLRGCTRLASDLTVGGAGLATGAEVQFVLVANRASALEAVSRCWDELVCYHDLEKKAEGKSVSVQAVAEDVGLVPALHLLARDAEQLGAEEMRLLYVTAEAIMRLSNQAPTGGHRERAPAGERASVPPHLLSILGAFAGVGVCPRPSEVERFIEAAGGLRTPGAEFCFLSLASAVAGRCMGVDLRRLAAAVEEILRRWVAGVCFSAGMAAGLGRSLAGLLVYAEQMGLHEHADGVMKAAGEFAPALHGAALSILSAAQGTMCT